MQSVSSRIWTRVAVSISYDDNHYTTNTSGITLHPVRIELITNDFLKNVFTLPQQYEQNVTQSKF